MPEFALGGGGKVLEIFSKIPNPLPPLN